MRLFRSADEVRSLASQAQRLFIEQRERDKTGHAIHLGCAAFWCFFLSWPTTYTEVALAPLLLCFVIRMTGQYRVLIPLGWNRAVWLALALIGWTALSAAWSAEPSHWLDDVGPMRYAVVLALLWPVLDRRDVLILALSLGLFCGILSQLLHAGAVWTHHPAWSPWHRAPARLSGWWDPVIAGSLLCAGLGLHLAGPMRRGGNVRLKQLAAFMSLLTLGCIGITGTRGAWIGAAGLVVAALGLNFFMGFSSAAPGASGATKPGTRKRRLGAAVAGLGALALIGGGLLMVPRVHYRFVRGKNEVVAAFEHQNYRTDTGARLLMWKEALVALATHPIGGVGAGGYHAWALAHIKAEGSEAEQAAVEPRPAPKGPGRTWRGGGGIHRHAHSWPMHTLATTGLVGAALTIGLIVCTIVGGARRAVGEGEDGGRGEGGTRGFVLERGYALGPMLAAIGIVLAGMFDSILVNQQTAAMWWTLVALCLTWRPPTPEHLIPPPKQGARSTMLGT